MRRKKICIITGSRAEYGLIYWLIKEVKADQNFKLQLIVTGMHLSSEYGLTYKEIEKDFKINKKIDINLVSDTSVGISRSMGIAQTSFSQAFKELKPDLLVLTGDRYETFSAASSAMISKIPIAHIHGGELTKGSWDDTIRHCISKMAHFHFTATEEYKRRVIQLGEQPSKVFNVGGMGIESIKRLKLLSKIEFEKSIKFKLNKKNIIVTFHPSTLDNQSSKKQFKELLDAIKDLKDTNIIFTKTNSDTGGKEINKMIDFYTSQNHENSIGIISLGHLRYLSALQYVDVVVGNSSSGILEAPSFKIGTINIGNRQEGRIKAKSVVDCKAKKKDIKKSLNKIYSKSFQNMLSTVKNPYDNGLSSKKILKQLKKIKLDNILKKNFFDIRF
tara:strand:- start:1282 stop:2445 length:1164 start_codon:yes stop_codon:yes gene_type:complete